MTVAEWTTFLGWCAVINYGVLLFSVALLMVARDWAMNIHSKMMGVDKSILPRLYFEYLGQFKILVIVFNIVPWVTLKIMA